MTTITYTVTTVESFKTRRGSRDETLKRRVTYIPEDTATGVVWSPGPQANTVWVLPYSGASQSEAVCVHAPTPSKPFWYREDAPWGTEGRYIPQTVTLENRVKYVQLRTLDAQMYRRDQHFAPALPPKTWLAALGASDVAQLAIAEDVAASISRPAPPAPPGHQPGGAFPVDSATYDGVEYST